MHPAAVMTAPFVAHDQPRILLGRERAPQLAHAALFQRAHLATIAQNPIGELRYARAVERRDRQLAAELFASLERVLAERHQLAAKLLERGANARRLRGIERELALHLFHSLLTERALRLLLRC